MQPLQAGDPQRVGRYRLLARLGAGGMGQVYFGRSAAGRAVAVKCVHPHFAGDPEFRQRFAREVAAAREVSGAFTAPVLEADAEAEFPWLVTSFVPSVPLDEAVALCGPLGGPSLQVLAVGLAEALNDIHRCGIIHRDLKPGNVLLAEDGPRVIDFGIAHAAAGSGATQSVIGTPGFMSPEQLEGAALQPSSDVFALGAVMVFAATGQGPFGEGPMTTMAMRVVREEPRLEGLPAPFHGVVAGCLAKDPRARPTTAQLLDVLGEARVAGSWLTPELLGEVRRRSDRAQAALAAPEGGAGDAGSTAVLGAPAPPGGASATQVLQPPQGDAGAGRTAVFGGRQAGAPQPQTPPTAVFGRGAQQPGGEATRVGDPAYDGYYRQGGDRGSAAAPPDPGPGGVPVDPEWQREQERRRRAEEQAHQERLRAEREAADRARRQARKAKAPSLWRFAAQLPLLVIPLIQIPLGIAAVYGWQWFTGSDAYWGSPWYFEPGLLSVDGFLFAMFLGYFLFNNLIGLDWVVRSLRSAFIVGVVLGGTVLVGTNAALAYFGFF